MGTSLWLKEVYFCFLLRIKLVMLGSVLVLPHYWVVRTFFFIAFFSYCLILYGTIRYKNIFEIFCWGKLFPSPKSVYFVLHKLGGYFMLFIFAWGSYFIPWSCLLSFLSLTVHQSPLCVHGNRILCIHTKHFQEVPRSLPVCRVGVLCVQLSLRWGCGHGLPLRLT